MYVVDEGKLVEVDLPEANINWTVYNAKSEEEFEGTYHIVGLTEEVGEDDIIVESNVTDVTNALASQHPSREPSFMHALDVDAMNALEFPEYINSSKHNNVIASIKDYTIRRGVDYWVCEFESTTFYANNKLQSNQQAAENIQVNLFDRKNEIFEVREMPSGIEYAIESLVAMPLHVVRTNDLISNNTFMRARFKPLGNPATWPVYQGPRHIPNQHLKQVSKGRPKITRFLNEMDMRDMRGPRRCRVCGGEGHSRSRCPHRAGSSVGGSAPMS
ncbi:hypothetical protein Ahy_A09g042012 [Arachis hypogaea]|uniref:CCHC-type domain-containing protein n=1 Tax=Arachis hypogaea TaxID=3818 RepID=A0A445BEI6_ARAHY|nr:hypothetical protein Ahy_A09g042012 [Arachis hypogaea]